MNNGYTKDIKTKESSSPETEIPTTHDSCIYKKKDHGCKLGKCSYLVGGVCKLEDK